MPGTVLSGSATLLDEHVRNWVSLAGATAPEALAAATTRPRALLGLPDPFAAGAPADFVLLDEALNLRRVLFRGEWV